MAKKRIHEIAKEQGLTSKELLARLQEAGLEGLVAISSIDEEIALEAITKGGAPAPRVEDVPAPWDSVDREPPRAAPAEPSARWGRPFFWLKTVLLVLIKGEGRGTSAPSALGRSRPPARPSATGRAPEAPRVALRPSSGLRAGAVALLAAAGVVGTGSWLLGAFDSAGARENESNEPRLTPLQRQEAALARFSSVSASVHGRSIAVYRSPRGRRPFKRLSNPNVDGAPLVFLVKKRTPRWLQVYLPMRPNGSVGWVRRNRVSLAGHNYRVRISLARHRLTAWNGRTVIANVPIALGRAVTPTPPGLYFITELLQQPDPSGPYGPFAFGISAYSNVLYEFAGADGILGIHGTNDPSVIGTDVSHGCIRMSNENITKLAHVLPAGTPVRIVRV